MSILTADNILLNVQLESKEEAIRATGQVLVNGGYVDLAYIDKMLEREQLATTYMGNYVAIPHGTEDAKSAVNKSGISILQVPDGVSFDGNEVKLLIGIAGKGDEHLEILSQIAIVCSEEENVISLVNASSKEEILAMFEEVE